MGMKPGIAAIAPKVPFTACSRWLSSSMTRRSKRIETCDNRDVLLTLHRMKQDMVQAGATLIADGNTRRQLSTFVSRSGRSCSWHLT